MRNERMTEAFRKYYESTIKKEHNNLELIDRWGKDPARLETQINCFKSGEKIPETNKYEEDGEVFGPHRWPYNAKTDPNYSDPPIQFIIKKRLKAIGTTWWDWKNKQSIGLGYDFDSIAGHADGVGIPDEELEKLSNIQVPWIEVIRSTRGQGRHLYIWFQEPYPKTANHDEHSALADAFLSLIARHTGLNIEANKDVCGQVMWIHHVDANKDNKGYKQVKPATQFLTADHVPPNWRDHLEVVSGGRSKIRIQGWNPDGTQTKGDELDEMTQAYSRVPLDDTHLKILEDLEGTGHTALWVHDHHLFQGHTAGLKQVYDEWAERGTPIRGLFDTNSLDSDPGKPNCFAGDTKVITREGVKPIQELAGKNVEIITRRGAWVKVPFKSYGNQEVFSVTIENRDQRKVIRATGDHRWYVTKYRSNGYRKTKVNFGEREEIETKELTPGRILVQTKPQCTHIPSIVGIQHGLVWGDGTNGGALKTSQLYLFGDKDAELLKYFSGYPQRPINRSIGGVEIWDLPYHFKSLVPLHYDKSYLYGWLAGYFAADGCVSDSGSCIIVSTDKESVEHVKQVCHILGVETSKITSRINASGYKEGSIVHTVVIKAFDLTEDFFLINKHKERWASITNRQHHYWRIVSVEPADEEEVFCCTVPETHCFCLEDFILVGNCFMRPKPNGAWDVYRFGEGTEEHPLWDKQGSWTHTTYNYPATLRQICMACGGFEGTEEKQGFMFQELDDLKGALKLLETDIKIPDKAAGRNLALHRGAKEKIVLVISKERGDTKNDFPRFVKTSRGWEIWLKDASETSDKEQEEESIWSELDDKMRALKIKGPGGVGFDSWVLRDSSHKWVTHPRENIKSFLFSLGFGKPDPILGGAVFNSWLLVNEPFQPEYPGGRKWNRDSAQFAFDPIELAEGETPKHPTWDLLLNHCGSDLDEYIKDLDWCKKWGINNGGEYLLAWVACMIQNPFGKLPYLFMYGPQNTGKSSFHEALEILFTSGVKKADRALTSEQGYNGELKDVILAVIDEVDINKAGSTAYNKLKEWTTGDNISIHAKYKTVQDVKSTLHFVQMANSRSSLPVFPGDTRITAMYVPPIENEIPRDKFKTLIRDEAPHFLRTLLDYETQPADGRLMLPVVETQGKKDAIESNADDLEQFIKDHCYNVPGQATKFSDFKKRFFNTLEEYQKGEWKDRAIKSKLSENFPVGRGKKINQIIVGNLTFDSDAKEGEPYRKEGNQITKDEI